MARMIDFSMLRKRVRGLIDAAHKAGKAPDLVERTIRIFWASEADAEHWIEISHDRFLGRADSGTAEVEPCPPGVYKIYREDPSDLDEAEGEVGNPITEPIAVGILLSDDPGAAIGAASAGGGDPNAMGQFQRSVSRMLEDARHELGRSSNRLREQEERADRYYREATELEEDLREARRAIRRLEDKIEELEEELEDAGDTDEAIAEGALAVLRKYAPRFLKKIGFEIDPEDIARAEAKDAIWEAVKANPPLVRTLRDAGAGPSLKCLGLGDDPPPAPEAS